MVMCMENQSYSNIMVILQHLMLEGNIRILSAL